MESELKGGPKKKSIGRGRESVADWRRKEKIGEGGGKERRDGRVSCMAGL